MQIPLFQRPYSWDQEQWSQLWEDLSNSWDEDYLMGGIVLCGGDANAELVIDGQQRVTTITIIAAAARDLAFERHNSISETVTSFHKELIAQKPLGSQDSVPYMTLGQSDSA